MNTYSAKRGFKTFIILAVVSGGIIFTTTLIPQGFKYIGFASSEATPENVQIAVGSGSVNIIWQTRKPTNESGIIYGKDVQPNLKAQSLGTDKNHFVSLKELEPNTVYYFKIVSQEKIYGKDGCVETDSKTLNTCDFYRFTTARTAIEAPTAPKLYSYP
ncbi:hypothetical protein COT52_00640 [candidate division WWE3 bacterium CG08_land_8_20_14_0_20_43_13]|uniref:Purple acid phosphatase N-terminal domain-containing protein n=1 Tax=candidate division WWE3 bacterium CG08_land_8_20_14_0_20_43_13 TaxID=1975087 RepID=A0A2H0X884_UNCKA|nr:MAG: hypothetical protein COT52_00640 [candidate division WWE3 bacterium CG08_land_8_20_14_0_20_43_13]